MKHSKEEKKTVLVTQTKLNGTSDRFNILHAPLISIHPLDIEEEFLKHDYDWLILTSKNAVKLFLPYMTDLKFTRLASIGEKTTEALVKNGYTVDFEPSVYTQEGFIDDFPIHEVKSERVLYPTSKAARPHLKDHLTAHGVMVDQLSIYEPRDNIQSMEKIREGLDEIDIVTFSSPSGVKVFMKYIEPEKLHDKNVISIGAVTKNQLDQFNVPSISPEKATLESMYELINEKFEV
ncbi:uroporphyrinogen-III synthase [Lacicoccus alkaliphilus]|uniref:Uroporphyrinogen-III synthase n=1 Tax=Lacicoccus alkaliphilus DSM 16010 TaxID=1123231 RepID=A0A1M7AYC0_9BACL|nr:uroporphyrinogen-III synthase [Salinicoccus alkaliphilus]SHL47637.1 uroporphyrinogen-III synthase [Salinicoccus alkaliphilus DSM 16010]